MKKLKSLPLCLLIWLITSIIFAPLLFLFISGIAPVYMLVFVFAVSLLISIPALTLLLIALPIINKLHTSVTVKLIWLSVVIAAIAIGYGLFTALANLGLAHRLTGTSDAFFIEFAGISGAIFLSAFIAVLILLKQISYFFSREKNSSLSYSDTFFQLFFTLKTNKKMEQHDYEPRQGENSNRILVKGLIIGGLILLMMIPTLFIKDLITEREERQKEVVKEVSSKWATSQTLSGPFITIPYTENAVNAEGKAIIIKSHLIVSADKLNMSGNIFPQERSRSIYKILLYRTVLNFSGNFKPEWPADINKNNIDMANAKLCFGLSDFKGIEEEVIVNFNNKKLKLSPGIPVSNFGDQGLSVPIDIDSASLDAGVSFDMQLKIKGSEQLHFIPMCSNSKYSLSSSWPNPSFDGNALPTERVVKDSGFVSMWAFNKANIPFGSMVNSGSLKTEKMAFGVSLVQPADQYNKTMRSVKYAILFIGLTFALFFIIEIMKRKPFHPMQYTLVGFALVIFYTLLVSISEYILFDYAYLIAAAATILLITLYAKSHFNSWKSASVFCIALSILYGFIFILIRLEDTALLVGSIGLFIILAVIMYVSRTINGYGNIQPAPQVI